MEIAAFAIVAFIVLIVFLFPAGLRGASRKPGERLIVPRDLPADREYSDDDVDTKTRRKIEVAQRLDQIAAEPGGLLRFDKNGDGVIESAELAVARMELALEIAAEKGEIPEASGVATPVNEPPVVEEEEGEEPVEW